MTALDPKLPERQDAEEYVNSCAFYQRIHLRTRQYAIAVKSVKRNESNGIQTSSEYC